MPFHQNPSLNRREAKMGFGDEIPRQVFGIVVMRPQCGAYSMTEIGNRKKRKAFLYEFPGSAALSSPQTRSVPKCESGSEASPDSANTAYLRFIFRITAPTSSFSLSSIAKKYRHTAYSAAYGTANISTPE